MPSRARAIIIKDNKILSMKRTKPKEIFWCCPGGMIEKEETNEQALIRECKEELGLDVKVLELFHQMESQKAETKGQMEYFYLAEIVGGELGSGDGPEFQKDSGYIGAYKIEWTDVDKLDSIDFRPKEINNKINEFRKTI